MIFINSVMKTDRISFGQAYIKKTLFQNLPVHNQIKAMSLTPLGELYPTDIYIGANKEGDLVIDMLHSTMGKHLYFSDEIPKTPLNVGILQILDSTERINRKQFGYKLPVYNIKIKNLDHFTIPELQYAVHERIAYYYQNIVDKKFFN